MNVTPTETVFLEEGQIFVSNTRFVVSQHVFALANVVSVRAIKIRPSRAAPVVLLLLSIGFFFISSWVGVIFLILACVWFARQKPKGCVLLTAAGGEVKAFESADCDFVLRIINALDQAIVFRG